MSSIPPVKIGVVGTGNISGIYLERGQSFEILEIVAVADLVRERAETQAELYGIPRVATTAEIMADPSIEMVLNLTTPDAHAGVAFQALEADKSVYNEKPLAIRQEDGRKMLALAKKKDLLDKI